jgi:hypothetical protein
MMILAEPDSVFGNMSISNAVKATKGKNVCFAAANPRVRKTSVFESGVFSRLKEQGETIENDELVDIAFKHGHRALLEAFDDEDENRTLGGISVRRMNRYSYSVIHNLPSVRLANFVDDDLKFFNGLGRGLSDWDGRWMRLLLRQNRLKVVGSSDLFFSVELTDDERNVPPLGTGLLNNDKYLTEPQRYSHNYICNAYCTVWRGKEGPEMPIATHSESLLK